MSPTQRALWEEYRATEGASFKRLTHQLGIHRHRMAHIPHVRRDYEEGCWQGYRELIRPAFETWLTSMGVGEEATA